MASQPYPSVLIADADQKSCVTLAALVRALGLTAEFAATGSEALAAIEDYVPSLVMLAVDLSEPSAYEVLRQLRERPGEYLPIAVLSACEEQPRDEIASLMLGADDYLPKPMNPDLLTARIRRLVTRSIAPSARTPRADSPSGNGLTRREREVLGLLVDGLRSSEIAESLCITKKTATTHIEHILAKLGAHSQAQAVAFAMRADMTAKPAISQMNPP